MITRMLMSALVLVIAQDVAAADARSAHALEEGLAKIESSIEVTKRRLSSQSETQFAPDLYFMLAELQHDKASAAAALKSEKNPTAPAGELDFTAEKMMSQSAIETLKLIEDRFPSYPTLDRVLYTIGFEYMGLQDEKNALAYFKKTSDRYPKSIYAIKSMIEVGNIFYQRKDYEFALQQYGKALPKAQEPERSSAYYKSGMCLIQSEHWLEAMKNFEQVYHPSKPVADVKDDIIEQSLVASVWPLLELAPSQTLKQPQYQAPMEYYRQVAGDKAHFRRALGRLATRLALKKRDKEAMAVSYELFRLADDYKEKKSAFETAYTLMKKSKFDDFPFWVPRQLRDLCMAMRRDESDKKRAQELVKYEAVFRDLVTTQNKKALATKRQEDLAQVAEDYEDYLTVFPRSQYASAMKLNRAEALFQAGELSLAGQAYLELSKIPPKAKSGDKTKEILESSLDSFLKALGESEDHRLERFQARSGYREAAAIFQRQYPRDEKTAAIRFNSAKTYYDEQKFDVAAKELYSFLSTYPNDSQTREAALLYLDCYYMRDQMKEMADAGKRVLTLPRLASEARDAVKSASSQAAMKAIRSTAGDFGSKSYALQFRDFAKKNKNSALGEQALYEAFVSLKSQNQPQAFDVGEDYVASYEKNPRAKEVLLAMAQQSMILLDYQRAASYLGAFSQKFPSDSNARALALQAAQIYENLGHAREAAAAYQLADDGNAALQVLFKYEDWQNLSQAAAKVAGMMGQYYQGVSLLRTGHKKEAMSLLERVASSDPRSIEEKTAASHAAVIIAETSLETFVQEGRGTPFSPALLQTKANEYQNISTHLQAATKNGGGKWVIGALYNLGRLNQDFANFLRNATPPAGMNPQQLQTLLAPQMKSYEASAAENFAQCQQVAEDNEIPTGYVQGCHSRSSIMETAEFSPWPKSSRSPASTPAVDAEMIKNPRSVDLLRKRAASEIRNGNPNRALLILSRASELAPTDALNDSYEGIAYLSLKQYGYAQAAFHQALTKNPNDPLANRGLAGIDQNFGFLKKAMAYKARSGSASTPGVDLHPWLK